MIQRAQKWKKTCWVARFNSSSCRWGTWPREDKWLIQGHSAGWWQIWYRQPGLSLLEDVWPPGRPGCHWETHGHACTALAGLTASKKTFCCNPDNEIKLATNWLIGSKLCEAVRNTLSWIKKHTFLRSDHPDDHFCGLPQWCCTSLP